MPGNAAHELSLWLTKLIVQTAEHTALGHGLVVLNKVGRKSLLKKTSGIERFCKPTSAIPVKRRLDNFDVTKGCIQYKHPHSVKGPEKMCPLTLEAATLVPSP